MEYIVNLYAIVEVDTKEQAEEMADKLVNADLPDEVVSSLKRFSYDDGSGHSEIEKVPEDLR